MIDREIDLKLGKQAFQWLYLSKDSIRPSISFNTNIGIRYPTYSKEFECRAVHAKIIVVLSYEQRTSMLHMEPFSLIRSLTNPQPLNYLTSD